MRSRRGPPKSSYTGTPRALALMSHRASSTPAMALWVTPPRFWRVRRSMSQYRRSTGRGSCPTSRSAMSRTQPAMPKGLRLSLHSPQPVMPASVSTLTNVHGRQPPSACSASTRVIFTTSSGPSPLAERSLEQRAVQEAAERRAHDRRDPEQPELRDRPPPDEERRPGAARRIHRRVGDGNADEVDEGERQTDGQAG